jgi:hypothetical protein
VLRIIPGRSGAEYWTMRCTRCRGSHLDIVKASEVKRDSDDLRALFGNKLNLPIASSPRNVEAVARG